MFEKVFIKNCCDGLYNSFDVHFTSACDNKCKHCIDSKFKGIGVIKPNVLSITKTIIDNKDGYEDVLFLGGEPCLYLKELYDCGKNIKENTDLKIFVTTAIPKTCYDNYDLFIKVIDLFDGVNLSVQHHDESIADEIRQTKSKYNRQNFYKDLPMKKKIRINLNIVKPYLSSKEEIINCLLHYDKMNFNSIKLSEIQHGVDHYVSFENLFKVNYGSSYFNGCQKYIDTSKIIPQMKTPLLLKRSCFMCEETLKASFIDSIKVGYKVFKKPINKYSVVYSNGVLSKGWL